MGQKRRGTAALADAEASEEWDDGRAMQAVARRDARAFRWLVDRHARALFRVAYRMLGDRAEAEDVVQESLLRLWDHAAGWQPSGGGLPAWLRRIATNRCLDRVRRTQRLSDEKVPERADDASPADAMLDADARDVAATRALQALPDRQRAAVVLTYYEELGNAHAAEALGMKLKAFESLLHRARAALRAHVEAAGITADMLRGAP